jgi:hypothetical protein
VLKGRSCRKPGRVVQFLGAISDYHRSTAKTARTLTSCHELSASKRLMKPGALCNTVDALGQFASTTDRTNACQPVIGSGPLVQEMDA